MVKAGRLRLLETKDEEMTTKPVFLGDGTEFENSDPAYWQTRKEYWAKASVTNNSASRRETYKGVALGYQMLIDGKAEYLGDGRYRVHESSAT